MAVVFPASLFAADTNAAMLYARGSAWLNGSAVPRSSAIFPGDLVQTKPDAVANINAPGSSVIVLSDSLIKFEGDTISVEHGRVSVATSRKMATRAGEVTVAPASNDWTEFDVIQANGEVQIAARKGDVNITDGDETTTLPQGQQTTRTESEEPKKKKKKRAGGAIPAGGGAILDSPIAVYTGLAVGGGILTWVLLQGDDPMSDDTP
jgi:hypothetical protein